MHTCIDSDLSGLLDTHQPRSVLVVGPEIPAAVGAYKNSHPDCTITHLKVTASCNDLNDLGHYDLGIISEALERMDKSDAGRLIAGLRDLHTSRFYAVVPIGGHWPGQRSSWEPSDLIAYGMGLAGQYSDGEKALHLYKFDINDYKKTPDWFNADHWANPELWDKYRW